MPRRFQPTDPCVETMITVDPSPIPKPVTPVASIAYQSAVMSGICVTRAQPTAARKPPTTTIRRVPKRSMSRPPSTDPIGPADRHRRDRRSSLDRRPALDALDQRRHVGRQAVHDDAGIDPMAIPRADHRDVEKREVDQRFRGRALGDEEADEDEARQDQEPDEGRRGIAEEAAALPRG